MGLYDNLGDKLFLYTREILHMLKKDIKPHSEKYVFFDFETKLDPETKKHIVIRTLSLNSLSSLLKY